MLEQSNVGGLDRRSEHSDGYMDVDSTDAGDLEAPGHEEIADRVVLQLSDC